MRPVPRPYYPMRCRILRMLPMRTRKWILKVAIKWQMDHPPGVPGTPVDWWGLLYPYLVFLAGVLPHRHRRRRHL
jgi:hypothetical protein